jgi:glycerate kinase
LKPDEYDPLSTTTYGTGELIIEALNKNAAKIILCIGGSATVDGGTGILKAVGINFFDAEKNELNNLPASLSSLAEIDITGLEKRIQARNNYFMRCRKSFAWTEWSCCSFWPAERSIR